MTAVSSVYAQRFIITIFLISFGIFLFLATVTYTPFDPGWMHISSDTQQVSNTSGVTGAWIADMLFGFLGWASLLIPVYFFLEAIQLWWPHSFLSRPFRYAAQFFILLTLSTLIYLLWNVPADTLDNASGGIIGYELGESLSQLITIYGAVLFLLVLLTVLATLAFGIQWNKTWATLKATPAYLQDLFYKNVPEEESAYDLTTSSTKAKDPSPANVQEQKKTVMPTVQTEPEFIEVDTVEQQVRDARHERVAEQLFDDMLDHEYDQNAFQVEPKDDIEVALARAQQVRNDRPHVVPTGEVWKALNTEKDTKQEIDALLREAEDKPVTVYNSAHPSLSEQLHSQHAQKPTSNIDWDNDEVFDELLSVVPDGKTATDIHQPYSHNNQQINNSIAHSLEQPAEAAFEFHSAVIDSTVKKVNSQDQLASELDDLASLADEPTHFSDPSVLSVTSPVQPPQQSIRTTSSYAQSSPLVKAEIQTNFQGGNETLIPASNLSDEEKQRVASDKDAFRDAWKGTTGNVSDLDTALDEEDEFDLDAPLTDAHGRPMSRSMQVAQKRRDLSPLPGFELLDKVDPNKKVNFTEEQLARLSELLEIKLQEFNVKAKVIEAQPGPVVTRFELDLAPGVKASKVTNISRDLARSMSMASVRVVEVIPGKPYIGIEVPNSTREMVRLIELVETAAFSDSSSILSTAMGKDISGNPVITDMGKAPHMLVAGTTGSGKSVAVNSMILSMLLKYTPNELRLILIDPKQLELANYNDIPHLLTPVVTDMKDAVNALNWCVNEMERRYKLMSFLKIRKLSDYNRKVEEAIANGEELIDPTWKASDSVVGERAPRLMPLPSIVIVADEFADMIMQVGKKAEEMITRLAQKSRAAGIHLLLATQRPSVDVITGLIKANIPTRVALRVNSKIDSRTILDAGGAEDLLGHGDMLFLGPGKIEPERVHGAFISDDEVNRICDAWRERGEPNYVDEILTPFDEEPTSRGFEDGDSDPSRDALYDQCVSFVLETRKVSVSSLQRKFSLGYNRAARIVDQMEENGIVSGQGANGKRDILV